MAAFIAPLIGLGVSGLSALFKKKPQPDPMISQLMNQNQLNMADAQSAIEPAKNYYTTALNGDPEALKALLGPNINTVLSQYDNAAKTATELGPRGAGRNAILADAPFKKAAVYGQQLAGARSGAAEGLSKIGLGEENDVTSQNNSLLAANGQQNKLNQENSQYNSGLLSSFGAGLGSLVAGKGANGQSNLSNIGGFFSKIFGGGGGGTLGDGGIT